MGQVIYLDYGAATPVDEEVLAAMQPYFRERFYNPSASYGPAKKVAEDLAAARNQIAAWLGAKPYEIIFTSGGTESNNLAIKGLKRRFPDGRILVSAIEHPSVLAPAAFCLPCQEKSNLPPEQAPTQLIPVHPDGIIDLAALERLIDERTILISVMLANNEIGTIQPISQIAQIVKKVNEQRVLSGNTRPLYLHSDASQAGNYLDMHTSRLGVDLMTINGGKIYGPKQSGALYVKNGVMLMPLIVGGGQERGLRSGTENVAGAIGLSAALHNAQTIRHTETDRVRKLSQNFIKLLGQHIPNVRLNGSLHHRLPNNVHITLPGQNNERLLLQLEKHQILAASGSACSASNDAPSHILSAIGLTDDESRSSIRFTLGRSTTETHIKTTVQTLQSIIT